MDSIPVSLFGKARRVFDFERARDRERGIAVREKS
jgi:hypothetical protein